MKTVSLMSLCQTHWRLLLTSMVLCLAAAGAFTAMQPKSYRAQATLLVRTSRHELVMGSNSGEDQASSTQVTEEDVNSEIELLRSETVLAQVVDDSHLAGAAPTPKQRELAILKLYKHLDVSAVRKTNVIQVSYYANSPEVAVAALHHLISRYLEASLAAHAAPNSYGFFADQLSVAQKNMESAQQQLSGLHQKTMIFSTTEQRSALIQALAHSKEQLSETGVRLGEVSARNRALEAERAEMPARASTQERTAVNLPLVEKLETNLNELERSRIALLAKYHPDDALVKVVDAQILSTRSELAATQQMGLSERTTDKNPLFESIQQSLGESRVELRGLASREQELKKVEAETVASLDTLDRNAIALTNLERAEQQAQDDYTLYGKRLEQARISRQMDRDGIANVHVLGPQASPLPVGPSLSLNLIVGLGAGALLGFALAWFSEVFALQGQEKQSAIDRTVPTLRSEVSA